MTEKEITYQIRGAIYDTYRALGPGLLESVYEEVLVYFLQKRGLLVQRQVEVPIEVDGIQYPDRIKKLYLDAPVLNLKSWPPKDSEDQELFFKEYNLNKDTFESFSDSPIDRLEEFSRILPPKLVIYSSN